MTQPAKSQEPSMEEILASIRRIIADDDANKTPPPRAPEPPKAQPEPPPPQPMFSAPPSAAQPRPRVEPEPRPMTEALSPLDPATEVDQASDILDLTKSMAAPMPPPPANPPAGAMPNSAAQFRTIDGSSDVGFDEASERLAAPTPRQAARSGVSSFPAPPAQRSIPPSMPWRRPSWCRMPGRLRIWCVKCCGRC